MIDEGFDLREVGYFVGGEVPKQDDVENNKFHHHSLQLRSTIIYTKRWRNTEIPENILRIVFL